MTLAEAIKILASGNHEMYCKICTVDSVDKAARTIDCTPIDDEDAPILAVNLQANQESEHGIVTFPVVGSFVVVGFLNPAAAVLLLADEIESTEIVIDQSKAVMDADGVRITVGETTAELNKERIIFNGGKHGGVVQVKELTEKLNKLQQEFDAFVKVYNGHIHTTTATVGDGPVGTITVPTTSAQGATAFSRADYENENVKH